jgi:Tfp pilus assembly protein PilO
MRNKTFVAIFCFVAAIIVGWFFLIPIYGEVNGKNTELGVQKEEISKMEKGLDRLGDLMDSYNKNKDKADLVLQMAPVGLDLPSILSQFETLSSQTGVILYSINAAADSGNSQAQQASTQAIDDGTQAVDSGAPEQAVAMKSATVNLKISGTYESFKNFLAGLEKSSRLADVQTATFTAGSAGSDLSGSSSSGSGDVMDFDVSCKVYYQ